MLLRRATLERGVGTQVYRIRLSLRGPDPRAALREAVPDHVEVVRILARLDGFDGRSAHGPWTARTLRAIREGEGVRAQDLADGPSTPRFATGPSNGSPSR